MMYYKLLDTSGIITSREPQITADVLEFFFDTRKSGITAVFEFDNGKTAYKKLLDGKCELDINGMEGTIKVCVTILNGSAHPPKWICEPLKCVRISNDKTIVYPDDINLQQIIIDLKTENSELRNNYKEVCTKIAQLEKSLESLIEGYDIT